MRFSHRISAQAGLVHITSRMRPEENPAGSPSRNSAITGTLAAQRHPGQQPACMHMIYLCREVRILQVAYMAMHCMHQ
eukprot:SAG22_NODE_1941_length_3287_cov_2.648055_3_plen_78_part_00